MTERSAELIGSHPQPLGYYLRLVVATFRTMLDLGMLVVGSGLVGLAVAVLLDGLELVEIDLGLSTGAMLGSAIVIGVVGAFALGIASEGGYGAAASVRGYPSLEIALGRVLGAVLVSLLLLFAVGRLEPLVADLAFPLVVALEVVRATGAGVLGVVLVAIPLAWGIRRGLDRLEWGAGLELPTIYAVWAVATLLAFSMPQP